MNQSYFQIYELRRKGFTPGVVWESKDENFSIIKLEILPKEYISKVTLYDFSDEIDTSRKNLVPFEIKEVSTRHWEYEMFIVGRRYSWSRAYMQKYYEPVLE